MTVTTTTATPSRVPVTVTVERVPKCHACVHLNAQIDRRRRRLGAVMDLSPNGDHEPWWRDLEVALHELDLHRQAQHPRRRR